MTDPDPEGPKTYGSYGYETTTLQKKEAYVFSMYGTGTTVCMSTAIVTTKVAVRIDRIRDPAFISVSDPLFKINAQTEQSILLQKNSHEKKHCKSL
jgi:hypothetical protein